MSEISNSTAEQEVETMRDQADKATKALASAANDSAEELESIQDRLIDTVTASQQEAIDTIESASQAVLDMFTQARAEISDFVAERIRQDLDTQQAFLRCRNLDEIRDVQVRFFRTALDQYGGEAAKLVRISGEAAVRTLDRARI
jgi:hypothetical protein